LTRQEAELRKAFPESTVTRLNDVSLTWKGSLSPSPVSQSYRIRLEYKKAKYLRIFALDKLEFAPGWTKLPHVYSTVQQQLCLYYPNSKEWNPGKLFIHTIIPWASEWFLYYEHWLPGGRWYGGGTTHGLP
jgi:hypothetical protein